MRKRLFLAGLMGLVMPLVAFADVAPLTPEGRIIMQKHEAFENHARRSFSDNGFIEKLRDWRRNWGFVIVGEEGGAPSAARPREGRIWLVRNGAGPDQALAGQYRT